MRELLDHPGQLLGGAFGDSIDGGLHQHRVDGFQRRVVSVQAGGVVRNQGGVEQDFDEDVSQEAGAEAVVAGQRVADHARQMPGEFGEGPRAMKPVVVDQMAGHAPSHGSDPRVAIGVETFGCLTPHPDAPVDNAQPIGHGRSGQEVRDRGVPAAVGEVVHGRLAQCRPTGPCFALSSTASQTFCVRRADFMSGWNGVAAFEAGQEVGEAVDERVLVADRAAGHPPVLHVGVLEVGHVDPLPAGQVVFDLLARLRVGVAEELQDVRVFQVEEQRPVLAVHLHGAVVLPAAGVAGALERADRAVLEDGQEHAGVVDVDLLDLARVGVLPLLDERLGVGDDPLDRAVEPFGRVDRVGQQVAGHAGAGHLASRAATGPCRPGARRRRWCSPGCRWPDSGTAARCGLRR